ncbi:hypothetical protein WOLCODRAFT_68586, partial [Wolfiporia cocos MD-104 SS10]
MTSIASLPVELLARIFDLGAQLDVHARVPFGVLASHVCAHWRAVALRAPVLWTHIAVSTVPHIARARVFLARSARLPVHLLVESVAEPDHEPGLTIFRTEFLVVFAALTPHILRWRSFVLRVRDLVCKAHARAVLSTCGPAPALDHLELWHIEDWGSPERLYTAIGPPPVVVFNGNLPSLSRLSLIGVNIQWAESASPFLRGLTELELGIHSDDVRIPFDRWSAVLHASPALRRLSLHYSGPRARAAPWVLPAGKIPLPALTDLRLVDLDTPYVCALLRTLDAPCVRALELELDPSQEDAAADFTPLVDLLA